MRIGVISDTHQELSMARKAIEKMGKIDLLLHAGDNYQDALMLSEEFGIEVKAVIGNCDYLLTKPKEEVFEFAGYKFLLTHGHRYDIKKGLDRIYYRGLELQADVVVFGHTHIPIAVKEGNIHLLNPGSTILPRGNSLRSYAVIDCTSDLKIEIQSIDS